VVTFRSPRWAGHQTRIKEVRSAFKMLTGTGKRPLGTCRWENNIRIRLREIGANAKKYGSISLKIVTIGETLLMWH
jgi:hypothetical protein